MLKDNKYKQYLKSPEWANIKLDLISTRGQKCERCNQHRTLRYLHVHHLNYERLYNEEPEDLEILCAKCHAVTHGIIKVKKRRVKKKRKKKKGLSKELKLILKGIEELMRSKEITVEQYVHMIKEVKAQDRNKSYI